MKKSEAKKFLIGEGFSEQKNREEFYSPDRKGQEFFVEEDGQIVYSSKYFFGNLFYVSNEFDAEKDDRKSANYFEFSGNIQDLEDVDYEDTFVD